MDGPSLLHGKAIQLQALTVPKGSRRLRLPESLDSRHMKVVRLSALHTGRPYSQGSIPDTHFSEGLSPPQGHSAAGKIKSMKISVAPSWIEPVTFRLVAQCLNQPCYRVLRSCMMPPHIILTTSNTALGPTLSSRPGGIDVCFSVSEENCVSTVHLVIHFRQIKKWDLFTLLLLLLLTL